MSIPAVLYPVGRRNDRKPVRAPATLRSADQKPLDVTVDDISSGGCHITTSTPMGIGDRFIIGIPGTGRHEASVVRISTTGLGCLFDWAEEKWSRRARFWVGVAATRASRNGLFTSRR